MQIHEMTRLQCMAFLDHGGLGRLACARDGKPFVVPLHFARQDESLFAFSTAGRKVDIMRNNPQVCILFEKLEEGGGWTTVLAEGTYEELPNTPESADLRDLAHQCLQRRAAWWEPGFVRTILKDGKDRPLDPVYFRVRISALSGRRGEPDLLGKLGPWARLRLRLGEYLDGVR